MKNRNIAFTEPGEIPAILFEKGGETMQETYTRYPITFSKKNEYSASDFRFIEVTIDVLHTGENLNKSSFTKKVIEDAIPSIKNTPILGYVTVNDDGIKDFKGHEHELKVDSDGVHYLYAGRAYGVIPESCNPRWVLKDDGTGVEREYLRVDGLLWTKFDEPCDIFARDVKKNQSMEVTDIIGAKEGDCYAVSSFKFDGCCILSTTDPSIQPAMTGSSVVANFSVASFAAQIQERLNEYQILKGETNDMDEKEKIVQSFGLEVESLGFSLEDYSVEDLEAKLKEMTASTAEPELVPENDAVTTAKAEMQADAENENGAKISKEAEMAEGGDPAPSTEEKQDFTITNRTLCDEIHCQLDKQRYIDRWGDEICRYWMEDVQENEVIVVDSQDYKYYGIPFSMDGDNVVLDYSNIKRKKIIFTDWEDGAQDGESAMSAYMAAVSAGIEKSTGDLKTSADAYAEIKPKYDAYVAKEAETKKVEIESKRNSLFVIMDKELGEDQEYTAIKENTEMEYEELEAKCYALLGKKAVEFTYVPSSKKKDESVHFGVSGSPAVESKYGDLFERYGVNK